MTQTRQQIITILENRNIASVSEISHTLKTSRQNISHHMTNLIKDGVIKQIGNKDMQGPGRPSILYGLSREMDVNNLDELASAALMELYEHSSGEYIDVLNKIAKRLISNNYTYKVNLTQQLVNATQYLLKMGYQSKWEARSKNPRIRFNHCPYKKILTSHPEICLLDKLLLEALLKEHVHQTARLEKDKNGSLFCLFELTATNST